MEILEECKFSKNGNSRKMEIFVKFEMRKKWKLSKNSKWEKMEILKKFEMRKNRNSRKMEISEINKNEQLSNFETIFVVFRN